MLDQAKRGTIDPNQWYFKWNRAFTRASVYKISDVEGTLGIIAFLKAVREKMTPLWAENQLNEVITNTQLGRPTMTLK
jgi:hypothetical protein